MGVQQLEYKAAFLINKIINERIIKKIKNHPLPFNWVFTGIETQLNITGVIATFSITEIPKEWESRQIINILQKVIK